GNAWGGGGTGGARGCDGLGAPKVASKFRSFPRKRESRAEDLGPRFRGDERLVTSPLRVALSSRRLDVGDLVKTRLRLVDEFAEARPFLAELGRMMRGRKFVAVVPLYVVHEMAAVLALVQAHRHEAGLRRHEAGALGHKSQYFGLVLRRHFDGRDLGHDVIVLADFGHVRSPACAGDNARDGMKFPLPRRARPRGCAPRSPARWRLCVAPSRRAGARPYGHRAARRPYSCSPAGRRRR